MIANDKRITTGDFRGLLSAIKEGRSADPRREDYATEEEWRQALAVSGIKFGIHMAKKWAGNNVPNEDLVAEAMLAVCEAAARHDPDRGAPFAAYSKFWCKRQLNDYVAAFSQDLKIPTDMWLVASGLWSDDYLVARGVKQESFNAARAALAPLQSLDDDTSGLSLAGSVADGRLGPLDEICEADDGARAEAAVRMALSLIDGKDREVLERLYGIGRRREMAKEVAADYGVSRQTIANIKARALKRVRDAINVCVESS